MSPVLCSLENSMRNIQASPAERIVAGLIMAAFLAAPVLYVALTGGRGIGQKPEPIPVVRSMLDEQAGPSTPEQAAEIAKSGDLPRSSAVVVFIRGHNYLCKPLHDAGWTCR